MLLASHTGSGKTLAYLLPLVSPGKNLHNVCMHALRYPIEKKDIKSLNLPPRKLSRSLWTRTKGVCIQIWKLLRGELFNLSAATQPVAKLESH